MDIEKIKNYNQKMLAVFSTTIVVASVIGLISLIVILLSELIPDKNFPENTLLSDDKVEKLKKDSLRQQITSYDSPRLVDTLNLIYIIPVNVKTLDRPEELDKGITGLLDTYGSYDSKFSRQRYYDTFNNLIIYDYQNNSSNKISDYRFIGTDLSFEYFDDEIIIAFTGAETDLNNDKKITLSDFQSLFIYSLKHRDLIKIRLENSTVTSFIYVENKKDILITFGYDRNKDNNFDQETEPTFVMKYDYTNNSLMPLVSQGLEKEIQRIIDKTN